MIYHTTFVDHPHGSSHKMLHVVSFEHFTKGRTLANDIWFSALRIVAVHSQGFYHMYRHGWY